MILFQARLAQTLTVKRSHKQCVNKQQLGRGWHNQRNLAFKSEKKKSPQHKTTTKETQKLKKKTNPDLKDWEKSFPILTIGNTENTSS